MIGNVNIGALVASLGMDISEFKKGLKEAEKEMQKANETLSNGTQQVGMDIEKVSQKFAALGTRLKRIGRDMSTYVTAPLAAVGVAAVKAEADFEFFLSKITGIIQVSGQQVAQWRDEILSMASEVAQKPQDLAESLYFITSAGLRGSSALEVLRKSAQAASMGMGDVKLVADLATDAINAFGLENVNAAETMDILLNAVRLGKVEAQDLVTSMGHVFPVAAKLNVEFHDVAAAIAAMTRTGTPARTAAVQIRQFLSQLIGPSEEAEAAFRQLSNAMDGTEISARILRETMVNEGLFAALEKFDSAIKEVGSFELAKDIFGNIRALTGVFDIMGQNLETNRALFEDLSDSAGIFNSALEVMENTLRYKWQQATASANSALIELGEAIKKPLIPLLEEVTTFLLSLIDKFNKLSDEQQQNIIKWGLIVAAIGPVTFALGLFSKSISTVLTLVGSTTKGFRTMASAIKAAESGSFLAWLGRLIPKLTAVGAILSGMIWLTKPPKFDATLEEGYKAIEKFFESVDGLRGYDLGKSLFEKIQAEVEILTQGAKELNKEIEKFGNMAPKISVDYDFDTLFEERVEQLPFDKLQALSAYLSKEVENLVNQAALAKSRLEQGLLKSSDYQEVLSKLDKYSSYLDTVNAQLDEAGQLTSDIKKEIGMNEEYAEVNNFFKRLKGDVEAAFSSFENIGQVFDDFDAHGKKIEYVISKIQELLGPEHQFKIDSTEVQYLLGLLDELGYRTKQTFKDVETAIAEAFFQVEEQAAAEGIFGNIKSEAEIAYMKVDVLKKILEDALNGEYGDNLLYVFEKISQAAKSLKVPLSDVGRMLQEYSNSLSIQKNLDVIFDVTPLERVNNELSLTKTLIENIASKSIISEEEISKLSTLVDKYKQLKNVQIQLQAQMQQANSVASVLGSTVSTLMQGIGEAIAGSFDFRSFLSSVAQLMIRLGEAIVVTSKAWIAFKTFLTTLPAVSLAAGLALIAAGAALAAGASAKSTSSGPPGNYPIALADGGIVYGPTNALIGEYPGAKTNPEVVSPLSTLKKLINDQPSGGQVEFKIDGYVLKGILNKMNKKKNVI